MSKMVKQLLVDDLVRRLDGVDGLLVAKTIGMGANDTVALRATLREKGVRALVVKNSMCQRAFEAIGLGYAKGLLEGPCTLIYGGESLVDTAKVLVEVAKQYKVMEVKGGAMEGAVLKAADVDSLSKLPSKNELVGMVVGAMLGQLGGVVGALNAPASQLASQLEKIAEKGETQEKEAA